ncbi:MAG: hypothetical protein WC447_03410 [Candidatus Paceibacterota bacterium]
MEIFKNRKQPSPPKQAQPESDLSETMNTLESSGIKVVKKEGWAVQFVPKKK